MDCPICKIERDSIDQRICGHCGFEFLKENKETPTDSKVVVVSKYLAKELIEKYEADEVDADNPIIMKLDSLEKEINVKTKKEGGKQKSKGNKKVRAKDKEMEGDNQMEGNKKEGIKKVVGLLSETAKEDNEFNKAIDRMFDIL